MPEIILKANAIGDYGNAWESTLKTGNEVYNKVTAVDTTTIDFIYTNVSGYAQSFKYAQQSAQQAITIGSVGFRAFLSSAAPSGAQILLRMLLKSTNQFTDLVVDLTQSSGSGVDFFTELAPDGQPWTLAKINDLQSLCGARRIVGELNVKVESIQKIINDLTE